MGIDNTNVNTTQFNFQPSIGVFKSHYLRWGIFVNYNYNHSRQGGDYNKTIRTAMGPYLRVYFSDYNVSPFFHTNLGYSRLKLMPNSDSEDVELKMNGFNYGIGLGLEIFNTGKYSLEFLTDYSGIKVSRSVSSGYLIGGTSYTYKFEQKGIGLRIGFNIFLK